MNALPKNVILIIAKFLVPQDIYNLAQTNTYFEFLETVDLLWVIGDSFFDNFQHYGKPPSWDQKRLYKAMCILKLEIQMTLRCQGGGTGIVIIDNNKDSYGLSALNLFADEAFISLNKSEQFGYWGELIIAREGFSGWDEILKRYVLIYSIKSLRKVYDWKKMVYTSRQRVIISSGFPICDFLEKSGIKGENGEDINLI